MWSYVSDINPGTFLYLPHGSSVSCYVNKMYSETHLIIPFISTCIWSFAVAHWTKYRPVFICLCFISHVPVCFKAVLKTILQSVVKYLYIWYNWTFYGEETKSYTLPWLNVRFVTNIFWTFSVVFMLTPHKVSKIGSPFSWIKFCQQGILVSLIFLNFIGFLRLFYNFFY